MSVLILRSSSSSGGGGAVSDGGSATIAGTGFGTAAGTQDFLGGLGNRIEAASNGTAFGALGYPSWAADGGDPSVVNSTLAYSRTKSIRNAWSSGTFQFGIRRDFTSYTSLYTNGIFRLANNGQTTGQLKIYRFVGGTNDGNLLGDGHLPNTLVHEYWGGLGSNTSLLGTGINTEIDCDNGASNHDFVQFNQWCRLEQLIVPGTRGSANGSYQYRATRLSDQAVIGFGTYGSRMFWAGSDPTWRWLLIQGYIGNEMQVAGATFYIDPDHYSVANCGTVPRFVYLGNAATLAACTVLSLCPYTTWTNTSISFTVNQGALASLAAGSVWAYPYAGIGASISTNGYTPS